MKTKQHVLVIINPAAGRERPILHALNRAFVDSGVTWDVSLTTAKGDASRAAAEAVADGSGVDVVAVYGGDGTVMEVANALHNQPIPLAILPGGTANVLAVELNIPTETEDAARLIVDPATQRRALDMGRVDDQLFFHLSIGFLGEIAHKTERADKAQSGVLAYILNGLKELPNMPPPTHFKLTLPEGPIDIDGISCMVTNFGKMGLANLSLAHTIDASDGIMDLLVIRDISLPTVIKGLTAAITSGEIADVLWHQRVKTLSISVDPSTPMMLDGETYQPPAETFTVEVVPGAVQVLVPGETAD